MNVLGVCVLCRAAVVEGSEAVMTGPAGFPRLYAHKACAEAAKTWAQAVWAPAKLDA